MYLDTRTWYVRWFFWSVGILEEFTGAYRAWEITKTGTNLCYFVRVLLFSTPLVLLLHVALYAWILALVTIVPMAFFGATLYGIILLGELGGGVLLWGLFKLLKKNVTPISLPPLTTPSFIRVLWEALCAAKKRVCPLITFGT